MSKLANTTPVSVRTPIGIITGYMSLDEETTLDKLADDNTLEIKDKPFSIEFTGLSRCPVCGKQFTPLRKDQIYDSDSCGNLARVREFRKRKKEVETLSIVQINVVKKHIGKDC